MKIKFLLALSVIISFTIVGCGPSVRYVKIIKIPDSSENRQAYRECQRTVAVAVGYDSDGYIKLKRDCMASIESNEEVIEYSDQYNTPTIDGCKYIDGSFSYSSTPSQYYYYFCKENEDNE